VLKFPLVQLPKKFKDEAACRQAASVLGEFPLVQLPKKFKAFLCQFRITPFQVSISSTSEEVQRDFAWCWGCRFDLFPLVQLPKKFKDLFHSSSKYRFSNSFH